MELNNKISHITAILIRAQSSFEEEIFTEAMSNCTGNLLMQAANNAHVRLAIPIERCIRTTIPYEAR